MSSSEKDRLIARYSTVPMGGGAYSVYDKNQGKFTAHYSGRGAYRKALKDWHTLVRSGVPGMDANAPRQDRDPERRPSRTEPRGRDSR